MPPRRPSDCPVRQLSWKATAVEAKFISIGDCRKTERFEVKEMLRSERD